MEKESISKWIIIYAIIITVIIIFFGATVISDRRPYPGVAGIPDGIRLATSVGIRNFAIALVLIVGLIHRKRHMLFSGFMAALAITLGDYIASISLTAPPPGRAIITFLIFAIVLWVPQIFCMRALMKK